MPQRKKKGKKQKSGGADKSPVSQIDLPVSDGELDTADNLSVSSCHSETLSLAADGSEEGIDESTAQENFEDKLKDCIDGTTESSAKVRTDCLLRLRSALSKKYIYEFVTNRGLGQRIPESDSKVLLSHIRLTKMGKITIADSLERSLKKGKADEQAAAAYCTGLLLIQLGSTTDGDEIYKTLMPILHTIMADRSASNKARKACAEAFGMCTFVAGEDLNTEQILKAMKSLEDIFKASYWKGDGSTPTHSPEVAALHASALSSWSLLLSIAPSSIVHGFIDSHLSKLPELLTSSDLDLRITAGETVALMYELAREEIDEDFYGDDADVLCETLKQLATDSNKYRAKKDRRQQRATFRDILRAVEEGDVPACNIKFGFEAVTIDSWVRKKHYDCLCHLLRSGMNIHLQENELIREIFELGPPIPVGTKLPNKGTKMERHLYNVAAFKARTKARGKFRDKRAATVYGDS